MNLVDALADAIEAGAEIENWKSPPMGLRWSDVAWQTKVSQEVLTELLTADPAKVDQILSGWVGRSEHLERYRRAVAAGDAKKVAWWRKRLLEDYDYRGPFPDDPPVVDGS